MATPSGVRKRRPRLTDRRAEGLRAIADRLRDPCASQLVRGLLAPRVQGGGAEAVEARAEADRLIEDALAYVGELAAYHARERERRRQLRQKGRKDG